MTIVCTVGLKSDGGVKGLNFLQRLEKRGAHGCTDVGLHVKVFIYNYANGLC